MDKEQDASISLWRYDQACSGGSGAALRFDGDYIAASIMDNDIAATNGSVAIHVASPSKTGRQRIEHNTLSGFAQGVKREGGN